MIPILPVPAGEAMCKPAMLPWPPVERAAVPSAAVRCVDEIWLAEDSRAQQCSG
jgi:hypothetical protein